jgi:hypothetical protein
LAVRATVRRIDDIEKRISLTPSTQAKGVGMSTMV